MLRGRIADKKLIKNHQQMHKRKPVSKFQARPRASPFDTPISSVGNGFSSAKSKPSTRQAKRPCEFERPSLPKTSASKWGSQTPVQTPVQKSRRNMPPPQTVWSQTPIQKARRSKPPAQTFWTPQSMTAQPFTPTPKRLDDICRKMRTHQLTPEQMRFDTDRFESVQKTVKRKQSERKVPQNAGLRPAVSYDSHGSPIARPVQPSEDVPPAWLDRGFYIEKTPKRVQTALNAPHKNMCKERSDTILNELTRNLSSLFLDSPTSSSLLSVGATPNVSESECDDTSDFLGSESEMEVVPQERMGVAM